MKATEMLNKVKDLLGVQLSEEVKLEQMKLDNGTVLEAESFEKDKEVFIVTEEDKVPVPNGEYTMEDGRILVVEEGLISDIKEMEEEVEEEEATSEEEEMKEEVYASKDEVSELKAIIEDLKAKLELKDQEQAEEIGLAMTTMLSEQEKIDEAVKEELSKPAAEPIKHNPEGEVKKDGYLYAQNRRKTTKDRVLERIVNF
tara:strand:- start:435 stop:1034 length:600 start_codon:yes stop_codon:yes gene_type:complete